MSDVEIIVRSTRLYKDPNTKEDGIALGRVTDP